MIPVPVTQLPPGSGGQENVQDNAGDEREDERDETADSNKGIDGNAFHGRPSCFFTMGAVIKVPYYRLSGSHPNSWHTWSCVRMLHGFWTNHALTGRNEQK